MVSSIQLHGFFCDVAYSLCCQFVPVGIGSCYPVFALQAMDLRPKPIPALCAYPNTVLHLFTVQHGRHHQQVLHAEVAYGGVTGSTG